MQRAKWGWSMIRLSSDPILPLPLPDEDVNVYTRRLTEALNILFRDIFLDLSLGGGNRRILSSVPNAAELDEGEIVLYESGVTRRLYTKINNSVRFVGLT